MKKTIIAVFCFFILGVTSANVKADTINLDFGGISLVGTIVAGVPPADQEAYLNHLLSMTAGTWETFGGQDYTRSYLINLPDATGLIWKKTDTAVKQDIVVDSIIYIAAKYDNDKAGTAVWYVGWLNAGDHVIIPEYWGKHQISSYSTWTSVPEPTTLLLLGLGLIGIAGIGRKLK
jgi:uncharacterized protein YbaA (DUF1428 family)